MPYRISPEIKVSAHVSMQIPSTDRVGRRGAKPHSGQQLCMFAFGFVSHKRFDSVDLFVKVLAARVLGEFDGLRQEEGHVAR